MLLLLLLLRRQSRRLQLRPQLATPRRVRNDLQAGAPAAALLLLLLRGIYLLPKLLLRLLFSLDVLAPWAARFRYCLPPLVLVLVMLLLFVLFFPRVIRAAR